MAVYLAPGVYVEEISGGPRPIEALATNIAGFVGLTERGPTRPRMVTNWGDFTRWFGDTINPAVSFLPFCARGYFENDGGTAFIARVVSGDNANPATPGTFDLATQDAAAAIADNVLRISANGPGVWGNRLMIWVRTATRADLNALPSRDWFRITILYYRDGIPNPFVDPIDPANFANPLRREPDVVEDYDDLTFENNRSNNVVAMLSRASKLVEAEYVSTANPPVAPVLARPTNIGAGASTASVDLATADADTVLRVRAVGPGAWGNNLSVTVAAGTAANSLQLVVAEGGAAVETYDNIPDASPAMVLSRVNSTSTRVRLSWAQANPPNPTTPSRPADVAAAPLVNGANTWPVNGDNGAAITPADFAGDPAAPPDERTGLAGLEDIDEVTLLIAPDDVNPAIANNFQITTDVMNQCERLKDRFAILSIAGGSGDVQNIQPPRDSSYGAVYYPWIRVLDARTQDTILIPPSGHVAGIYARVDDERGVHKAPANEVVRGIVNRDINAVRRPLEYQIAKAGQEILNPRGVNVIRDFRSDGRGIRVWGARTMSSDPEWRYVNVRRLFLNVEESVEEGTQWVVFEPNDENTWARVRLAIRNYLLLVWRSGALRGLTEEEAFFVNCDRTTMTEADIDAGRLICEIGIAPVKPAEFVIFRFQQKTLVQTS